MAAVTHARKHPGGVLAEKLGGVCGQLLNTLSLFMTKLRYLPYLCPDQTFETLFMT